MIDQENKVRNLNLINKYLQTQDIETPHSIETSEYMPERAYLNKIDFTHPLISSFWFILHHCEYQPWNYM